MFASFVQNQCNGNLEICGGGLRVRPSAGEMRMTPFHNIAVWSAVKFVVSQTEGGAAFLPLITDPENIDKKSLYQPLRYAHKNTFNLDKSVAHFHVCFLITQFGR